MLTQAHTTGVSVGSSDFTFVPCSSPLPLPSRKIVIDADDASSTLVFQAIFPYLLFAQLPRINHGGEERVEDDDEIDLTIRGGGVNVFFAMSYDYLDQVLLPTLESHFGAPRVQRQLLRREWIQGKEFVGAVRFRFKPLAPGTCLRAAKPPSLPLALSHIDITLLVPSTLRGPLLEFLDRELSKHFPSTPSKVVIDEDSGDPAGVYVLIVAHHADSNIRFGRDHLYDQSTKGKKAEDVAAEVAQKIVRDLKAEVELGGEMDEWLEDQVAVFQGLAEGRSGRMSEPSGNAGLGEENKDADADGKLERDMLFTRTNEPFGPGSLHAQTARWVVAQLLPGVEWFDKGAMCEGVGWKATPTRVARAEESSEIGRSIYKLANGVAEVVLQ